MLAGRFIDRSRIGGQLVPKPIEVDALASFHEPLDVRSAEIEMPQQWAARDLLPGANTRQRGVYHDKPHDALGKLRGERIPHHVADVMGDDIGFLNPQSVQNPSDIAPLRRFVIAALGV